MGVVIRWRERQHARASAASLAANSVSLSEVTPAPRASSVPKIADHHSAGMLSRCHHLETVGARAEMSEAMASFEGHSSITSRKDRKSAIGQVLGQLVLKRKDNLALDGKKPLGHTVPMADSEKEQYEQEFIARVKSARIATGMKQWQVAEALGVKQDFYKHWEVDRLMPHHLMGRFCIVCRVEPTWLVTGKGKKPLQPPHIVASQEPAKPKAKRAKRSRAA